MKKNKRRKIIKRIKMIRNLIIIILIIMVVKTIYIRINSSKINQTISHNLQIAREKLTKDDRELLGKRLVINRKEDKGNVKVNIYIPGKENEKNFPIVFDVHGGNFSNGDADLHDTLCNKMKDKLNAVIVSINYTKLDVQPKNYAIEEIADTVLYFAEHSEEYKVDMKKCSIIGYSAGAYYVANAVIELNKVNFNFSKQILVYPYIGDTVNRVENLKNNIAPTTIIICGKDDYKKDARKYKDKLEKIGTKVDLKEYKDAYSGFIEENNLEYNKEEFADDDARSNGQAQLAKEAEEYILSVLQEY